jgi:hypothetical protein
MRCCPQHGYHSYASAHIIELFNSVVLSGSLLAAELSLYGSSNVRSWAVFGRRSCPPLPLVWLFGLQTTFYVRRTVYMHVSGYDGSSYASAVGASKYVVLRR